MNYEKSKSNTGITLKKLLSTDFSHNSSERGFTIIETLVALTIFTMAITGMLVLTGQGVLGTSYAKNRLTAGFLAQEAIELFRYARDTTILNNPSTGWDTYIVPFANGNCQEGSVGCAIDTRILVSNDPAQMFLNIVSCASASCTLYYDDTTGSYSNQVLGTPTVFTRSITVSPVSFGTSQFVRVTATVSWKEGSGTRSLSATENLFDWFSTLNP